jgi:cytoskeletal protein CcmA (bactofilin family)
MALFCKLLIAQQAFIEELQSQIIKVNGAIYGGNKYLANGDVNPQAPAGAKGFYLGSDGVLKAEKGEFTGKITAESGTFTGEIKAKSGTLDNVTINKNCTVNGNIIAKSVSVIGSHSPGNIVICEDNRHIENRYTNLVSDFRRDGSSYKCLRVAGQGQCTLFYRFRGQCLIYVNGVIKNSGQNKAETWADQQLLIDLPKKVNTIELEGWYYGWGTGTGQEFGNTTFSVRGLEDPGLFAYMSG